MITFKFCSGEISKKVIMAPKRQISAHQLETMISYLEANRIMTITSRAALATQQDITKAWEDLALKLNSCRVGMLKPAIKWKRYWHMLKCRTKAKAALRRRSRFVSSAGTTWRSPVHLSNIEERIITLVKNEMDGDKDSFIADNIFDEDSVEMDPFETIKDHDINEDWGRTSSPDVEIQDHTDESVESQEKNTSQRISEHNEHPYMRTNEPITEVSNGDNIYMNKIDFFKIKIQEEELNHQRDMHKAELKHRREMHRAEIRCKQELQMAELMHKEEVHKEELKHKRELHAEELKMKVQEREYLVKNWEIALQTSLRTAGIGLIKQTDT